MADRKPLSTTSSRASSRLANCKIMKFNKTPERKRKQPNELTSGYSGNTGSNRLIETQENSLPATASFKFEKISKFNEVQQRSRIFSADDMGLKFVEIERKKNDLEESKEAEGEPAI